MKNVVCCLLLIQAICLQAQNAFEKGTQNITLGYGGPNIYKPTLKSEFMEYNELLALMQGGNNGSRSITEFGFGPVFLKNEYAISNHVGVGVVLGYFSAGIEEVYNYQLTHYNFVAKKNITTDYTDVRRLDMKNASVGVRVNFHFAPGRRVDPFLGVASGYKRVTMVYTSNSNNPDYLPAFGPLGIFTVPAYLAATLGLRVYFTNNIGLYAEAGIDKWAIFQGGIAVKF